MSCPLANRVMVCFNQSVGQFIVELHTAGHVGKKDHGTTNPQSFHGTAHAHAICHSCAMSQSKDDTAMSDDGFHGPADQDEYRMSELAPTDVGELMRLDAEDESLRRYKEQLLGSAAHGDLGDRSDARRVVVEEFKVVFEDGRQDILYRLDTPQGIEYMRTTPFAMDEGVRYKFAITFRVNHAIVSGLRFRNKVKKTVLSTTDEIVLGSYAPRSQPYEFLYPRREWMDAPSGMFYRGKYMAQFRFIDDDEQEHLKVLYTFEIKKAS